MKLIDEKYKDMRRSFIWWVWWW